MTRALVAQFFHEANSFNTTATRAGIFTVLRGADIIEKLSGSGSVIGGILDECQRLKVEVIPTVAANAVPGGPIEHTFFEHIADEIIDSAIREAPELILLELHGATVTSRESDPEGLLLERLRCAVGGDTIIAVGLDLHGHITDRMLTHADILTACKHNPHQDFYETGVKVVSLALRSLTGEIHPVIAVARVPMLLAGNTETHAGPLRSAHQLATEARVRYPKKILDVSIFNCHPLIDVPAPAQVVLAIADGPQVRALTLVKNIAEQLWRQRADFRNSFPTIEAGLQIIATQVENRPYVVADYGDRTLAGATGDSSAILSALLESRLPLRAVIPIVAPDIVQQAQQLGPGAEIVAQVGGIHWPEFERLSIRGRVINLGDGAYTLKGPMLAGQPTSVGPTAVIALGDCRLVAISTAGYTHDIAFFESVDIDVSEYDFVVVKSGNHFQLSFAGIATPLKVDSPGIGTYRPGQFPLKRAPVFPEIENPRPSIDSHFVQAPVKR